MRRPGGLSLSLAPAHAWRSPVRWTSLGTVAAVLASTVAVAGAAPAVAQTQQATQVTPAGAAGSAPDVLSASLQARLSGKRVEVLSARTESSSTFALPDGTWSTESSAGPVRMRSGEGWVDVDTSLVAAGEAVQPRATPAQLRLSGGGAKAGSAPVLAGLAGGLVELGWKGQLPTPVLKADTATYPQVLPGSDLVMRATRTGFEQFLLLRERPTRPLTVVLPVRLKDARLSVSPAGDLVVTGLDGKVRATAPAPRMWGAQVDPASGEPTRSAPVAMAVSELPGGRFELHLTPDPAFLADPEVTLPITVDPSLSTPLSLDTWVQEGYSSDQSGSTELRAGTFDAGATLARSFLNFDVRPIKGKHVLSTKLSLYNWHSYSCTASPIEVWTAGAASTATTWSNQPAIVAKAGSTSAAKGYSSACPAGWVDIDLGGWGQAVADNTAASESLALRASETSSAGWKKFNSGNASANLPTMTMTYNSYPATVAGRSFSPRSDYTVGTTTTSWVRSATPTLVGAAVDADGGQTRVFSQVLNAAGTVVAEGWSPYVAQGTTSPWTVPPGKLADNVPYTWRARGHDGTDWSKAYASSVPFTVDTSVPAAPAVSSAQYPRADASQPGAGWSLGADQAGTFTLTPASSDTGWVLHGLDTPNPTTAVATTGQAVSVSVTPPTDGEHVLYVRTKDKAGNLSPVVEYPFRVGAGTLVLPRDGDRTAKRLSLKAAGRSSFSGVRFEYRRGEAGAWTAVPVGHVTNNGVAVTAWPVAAPQGTSPELVWDATDSLGQDALIEVRALMNDAAGATVGTAPASVTVDRQAAGAASEPIGPGSVNLLTGDYALSDTDTSIFGLSVTRTASSREPTAGLLPQGERLTAAQTDATDLTGFTFVNTTGSTDSARGYETPTQSLKLLPAATGTSSDTYASLGGDGGTMRLGMQAGRTYRISGRLFVPAATGLSPTFSRGLQLSVHTRIGTNPYVAQMSNRPAIVDAWQPVSLDVTVPVGATEAFVRLYNGFTAGSGKAVWFDDLSVRELTAPFGPQWSTGAVAEIAESDYTGLQLTGATSAELLLADGDALQYAKRADGSWQGEPGTEGLTLAATPTAGVYTLTDTDATVTTFSTQAGTDVLPVTATTPSGAENTTRYTYGITDKRVRINRVIAPSPTGVGDCITATPAVGCQVLEYVYGSVTPTAGSSAGLTVERVTGLKLWATTPGASASTAEEIQSYRYDTEGRLSSTWDPRLPDLVTSYGYDSAGRVTTVTPPGEQPWTVTHGQAGDPADTNTGRLLQVSRPTLAAGTTETVNGTASTSVVYTVPLSRSNGGPHDLNPAAVASWGQTDQPSDATAIFPADSVPTVHTASSTTPGPGGYGRASVHYLNPRGLQVNEATPGGHVTTSEHDGYGNVIRTLTARNRALALGTNLSQSEQDLIGELGLPADSASRAAQLDETSTYSPDGTRLLESLGPLRMITLETELAANGTQPGRAAGNRIAARSHTVNRYDEGRPATAKVRDMLTSRSTGASIDGYPSDADVRTTSTSYDSFGGGTSGWELGQPTRTTTDPGGLNISRTTVYDSTGKTTARWMPNSNGADAGTTISRYYTAGAHPSVTGCGDKPAWAGLLCQTAPAGAITGSPAGAPTTLPTVTTTYTRYGAVATVTETNAGVTRTTTTSYDGAARPETTTVSGGLGQAVPDSTTSYSATTGRAIETASTTGGTIKRAFDSLGRQTKYTDADGAISETQYDALNRPRKVLNALGGDQTFDYEGDPRGLPTAVVDSQVGTWTGQYDPDGQLIGASLPGGLTLEQHHDTTGSPQQRTYSLGTGATQQTVLDDQVTETVHGQWATHSGVSQQAYGYDPAGRLTAVQDTTVQGTGNAQCTTRIYRFDAHSNRTGLHSTTVTPAAGQTSVDCATPQTPTISNTYDSSDRLTTPGHGYDAFGRTTTLGDQSLGYYANDLLASQTTTGRRHTWTLDANQRFRAMTVANATAPGTWTPERSSTNHYDDDTDSPSHITDTTTAADGSTTSSITRYTSTLDGTLLDTRLDSPSPSTTIALSNLHGDSTIRLDATTPSTSAVVFDSDEYGNPRADQAPTRYGWLGSKQRSTDTLGGLTLMGVRLYDPASGRFLSMDPVVGGNDNAYIYPADPVNAFDLDGRWKRPKWVNWKNAARAANIGAFGACLAISAGLCAVVGVTVGAFTAWEGSKNARGRRCFLCMSWAKGAMYSAAWAGTGYGVGRGLKSMYSRAPRGGLDRASYRFHNFSISSAMWAMQSGVSQCWKYRNRSCSRRRVR